LVSERYSVHGTIRNSKPAAQAELQPKVNRHQVDLLRRSAVEKLVKRTEPDWVFHLAALSSVADSWKDPARTLINNVGGEANLLSALLKLDRLPRVLIVGSSDEYGKAKKNGPLNEETPLRPLTPYGVSKVAQDMLGLQFHLSHGLHVVRVRPFNHTGPRQSPHFAIPSFARQIARIELGKQSRRLKVGNLDVTRDFTDVRDIVRAYRLAVAKGKPGEVYNIGSGRATRLADAVGYLVNMSRKPVTLQVDEGLRRSAEAVTYVCDARRFRRLTGWRPEIPLEQTLRDTLEYWRRVEAEA
jgi:GDP-4-dehydro-6-deoxy-D-mannose reductase